MINKLDHRELEYYNFLLKKNIEKDPEYLEDLKCIVISKKVHDLYEHEGKLHLYSLKTSIPRFHVEHMSGLMQKFKGGYMSKYGLFRMCENYITHTAWFLKLDDKLRYVIHTDFYKTIILEIHRALKLIEAYKKFEENKEH
ncbi:hypothetical protein [Seonamhaeicola maritimus]|uniref:hypothetical protein n=1 Tax=Seonamhaeicola maritimus TaxID=2591822 RepID=UPI0024948869|nr:hypothetical protein [Seonamhaeicola maritimus]